MRGQRQTRGDYGSKIEQQFPAVTFNGRSSLHRSIYRTVSFMIGRDPTGSAMRLIVGGRYGFHVYQLLRKTFADCEWLVKGEQLDKLLAVDVYRHLAGEGDSHTKGKLVNPTTGSKFHKIAICGTTVCGVRIFLGSYGDQASVSFRFRLEQLKQSEEAETRSATSKSVVDADAEYAALVAQLDLDSLDATMKAEASELISKALALSED